MPGPSSFSRNGSTAVRTRERAKDGSAFVGSCQGSRSCAAQISSISFPPQAQEGAQVESAPGRHTGQRPGAGAAGQPQQHLLGLVIQGVAEQHRVCPGFGGSGVERFVAHRAGGGLRAHAGFRDLHPGDGDGVQPHGAQFSGSRLGDLGRAVLQPVVDDGGAHP